MSCDLDLVVLLSDMGEKIVIHAELVGSQALQCWRLQAKETVKASAGPFCSVLQVWSLSQGRSVPPAMLAGCWLHADPLQLQAI